MKIMSRCPKNHVEIDGLPSQIDMVSMSSLYLPYPYRPEDVS